ncbi:MAG: mannitol dehydrogenase family protein [Caulobacteraceae bacterium]|nr:mannitol dehydrogenase family protein [Caulobacteraceae bacterium]
MIRLSPETLDRLPADIARPAYDRAAVRTGVVHLGIGAFHRAHQADVFDRALASGDPRWGILGASLRSPGVRDQLEPQEGLYALSVREGSEDRVRIIGAVTGLQVVPEDPAALIERLAHPDVHLVTLTVTEKGYRLDPASGALLADDPDVIADLADPARPRTAPAVLAAGLRLRRERGQGPLTVISCDNLPHNGARVRDATLAFARAADPATADWIEAGCTFPQTMVDRIVPATTPEDIDALAQRLGVRDEGMVKTEPFLQWVIEDRFAGERPDFEALGVRITASVAPWEDAKLRLLNGAHSALAYLGGLAGIDFVHQAVAAPTWTRYVTALWDEAETTLSPPAGLDVAAYRRDLFARFANASLNHRTRQIAMDGSQKLPQRLVATAAARVEQGLPLPHLALAIAGWMRWQAGQDDAGAGFVVDDPLAATTRRLLDAAGPDPDSRARALLSLTAVFPPSLACDPAFHEPVIAAHGRLCHAGARAAVEALVTP